MLLQTYGVEYEVSADLLQAGRHLQDGRADGRWTVIIIGHIAAFAEAFTEIFIDRL